MEFYARTNDAGAGEFYARTNLVSNLQTIFLQNADTSSRSLAFNLGFDPADADHIYVPQTVAGSTLTANSKGIFVLSPAVPDGTTFERITLQVSTGVVRTDIITISDTAGQNIEVSGSAAVTVTGTQTLNPADDITVTGSATVTVTGQAAFGFNDVVTVNATADVQVTGTQGTGAAFSATVDASASVDVTGTQGDGAATDVYISSVATVSVSGYSFDLNFKPPTNRIFLFD